MQRKIAGILVWAFFLYPIINLQSCSSNHNHVLRSEISGKGILSLDLNNPYLAPNKFLSEEAKRSETLKGFLSLKGAPDSLSFSDPLIGLPTLTLIYKDKNEKYSLEDHGQEWVIHGPENVAEGVAPQKETDLSLLEKSHSGPVLLPTDNASTNQGASNTPDEKTPSIKAPPKEETKAPSIDTQKPSFRDVYHEVLFEGQTLDFIAYWYTGNSMNVDRVRRINTSLKEKLRTGDIVRVPSYLAQRDTPPTQEDLAKFSSGVLDTTKK